MANVLLEYENLKKELDFASTDADRTGKTIIQVGSATCEKAAGSDVVRDEFLKLIRASGRNDIVIKQTGCTGRCAQEPIVTVFVPNQIAVKYSKVNIEKVDEIFSEHIIQGNPLIKFMLDKHTNLLCKWVMTLFSTKRSSDEFLKKWGKKINKILEDYGLYYDVRVLYGGEIESRHRSSNEYDGNLMIFPENILYGFSSEEDIRRIIEGHFINNDVVKENHVFARDLVEKYIKFYGDLSFFNKQNRITLRNCGIIDPESLVDYIHAQGYEALAHMLFKGNPDWIIDEIIKSGLRGRGGGGFPTGLKWKITRNSSDDPVKYVICNADEGDPGAFMDRSALEGDPFSIIEGMTIGGYAMGAVKGFIYVRAEYPLAIKRLENAIKEAHKFNLLGKNILGSDFSFDIEIRLGAGAFVCGEETALIQSIEGKRGQPKFRPPYPSVKGLWGHPTSINNVETWANVPAILLYGSEWFSSIGTEGSKGTKVFALAGKVKNTGLVEVPMGTTLREIIYDIGGGIPNGYELKAVQTGGPSGGCIPADKIDTPVDYESLKSIGSMMGSGGMIVLDETDCIVSTCKFFLEFTKDESCGKCLPCREGTVRMLEILEKITNGTAVLEDLDKLRRLGKLMKQSSLCGLGQSAPNPVLSSLDNYYDEFVTHITEQRCPTQRCTKLIHYTIDPEKCNGCTVCARRCPSYCITGTKRQPHEIMQDRCIKCGECYNACKFDAIIKI